MGILDKINKMEKQGLTEPQIINILSQEGISPREINEALSQSKIKSAIKFEPENPENSILNQNTPLKQENIKINSGERGMSPSIMYSSQNSSNNQNQTPEQNYPQQDYPEYKSEQQSQIPEQNYPQQDYQKQNPGQPNYHQQNSSEYQSKEQYNQTGDQNYPEQNYPEYQSEEQYNQTGDQNYPEQTIPQQNYPEYQPEQQSNNFTDVETINDIAEQIIEEKIRGIKKSIVLFKRFQEDAIFEIKRVNQRLTKIEENFSDLQTAILRKIGGYGEDIQNISKEMRATQDSFSKILNPLTNNFRELQKITQEKTSKIMPQKSEIKSNIKKMPSKKKIKSKIGFEDYLR